jgi:hypothetical protein
MLQRMCVPFSATGVFRNKSTELFLKKEKKIIQTLKKFHAGRYKIKNITEN